MVDRRQLLLDKIEVKKDKVDLKSQTLSRVLFLAINFHRNNRFEEMIFKDSDYLLKMYLEIEKYPKYVVEKSVQMGVSELLIILSHQEASERAFTVMYVLPKYEIRNRFVNNRIYRLHQRVPYYKELLKKISGGTHRVSLCHVGSGTIAFVGSNVEDEFIEIPIDSAIVDEKDNCNQRNLLLLPDRYSRSPYQHHREVSNPRIEGFGIDQRFAESTQGLWNIKCDRCNDWFSPDFFQHIVREVGPNQFELRDPDWEPGKSARMIHTCGKPVDRLKQGSWIDKYINREWVGRRINKTYSSYTSLESLWRKWIKIQGNEQAVQFFYNSELGLPYTNKGSKITYEMLNKCCRSYEWPMPSLKSNNTKIMGIDVGALLHYIIRDIVRINGTPFLRLCDLGAIPSFSILKNVMKEWRPRYMVIDALPEIHKVMDLKSEFDNLYSSKFQEGLRKVSISKSDRELSMDRTALLDFVKQGFEQQTFLLPKQGSSLEGGIYYDQLCESTRILDVNEANPEKSRFVWEHTNDDHFFLAEAYCFQASLLVPNLDVFEFYDEAATSILNPENKRIDNISEEEQKRIEVLQSIDAQSFLSQLRNTIKKE